jgi:hypothetical protein
MTFKFLPILDGATEGGGGARPSLGDERRVKCVKSGESVVRHRQ